MIRRIQRALGAGLAANLDLLLLWLAAVVAWPLVPEGTALARPDLAPWMILTLAAALALRGRRLGAGPHPMLTPRKHGSAALARRAAVMLSPVGVGLVAEAAATRALLPAVAAALCAALVAVLLAVGSEAGLTGWRPPGRSAVAVWALGIATILGGAAWIGLLRSTLGQSSAALGSSGLLGLAFLAAGLVDGRVRHMNQRRAAGNRDGSPWSADLFPFLLAALGPSLGLFLLHLLFQPMGGLSFDQAWVAALHVVVWVGLVWPPPEPLARAVILHEVEPVSGQDREVRDSASPFDEPPEGALQLDPRRMRRTRVIHPWLVPVRASRIADLDDPIRPLWPRALPPLPAHALGEAAFEPDPLTRATQTELITLRMKGGDETVSLSGGEGLTRRIAILRPFLPPGAPTRARISTYTWDAALPEESVQVIDAGTRLATLRHGDIIVVSVEGVARAVEVDLGALIFSAAEAALLRPPQLGDYVGGA